jgi:hypothetical protein
MVGVQVGNKNGIQPGKSNAVPRSLYLCRLTTVEQVVAVVNRHNLARRVPGGSGNGSTGTEDVNVEHG